MAVFMSGGAREAESVGVMTEGAAGLAVVVLAIIGLANVAPSMLAAIVTIVIGAGLLVEAFNTTAEQARALEAAGAAAGQQLSELGGRALIELMVGLTGVVLGILGVLGTNTDRLIPAALIVFGAGLLLGGTISSRAPGGEGHQASYRGSAVACGFEVLVGLAAIVLGILALIVAAATTAWILTLIGFIAVGAALLVTSATFNSSVVRLFTSATG